MENPFTDDYVRDQIKFYSIGNYENRSIKILTNPFMGRHDDYLNKNFRFDDSLKGPAMFIDGKIWMSLAPMEIQSHYIPIKRATGRVATAGIGMGYYIVAAMRKPEVESIDVYEMSSDVIDFFNSVFHKRDGFEKVNIIQGDVRKLMKNKEYDSVYMDTYPTLLPNEVIPDIDLFVKNNKIKDYRFWGQEKVILAGLLEFKFKVKVSEDEEDFFNTWVKTKMTGYDSHMLCELYHRIEDKKYVHSVLKKLKLI